MSLPNDKNNITSGSASIPKRNGKDTVFQDLFSNPRYLLELYKALHPEDESAKETDLKNVTISNVLVGQIYNDLAFTARDRLMIMLEAQSTWTMNILVRMLMYFADTWNNCIKNHNQNPYGSRKLSLPKPEFYVVYTGGRENIPDWISLSEEFFDGDSSRLDLRVKVITAGSGRDIINQYIIFTKVYDQQIREYGRTIEAIKETIRICRDMDVLKEYLETREKEVIRIMSVLFDQDYLTKVYGMEQREEGRTEILRGSVLRMHGMGLDSTKIAEYLGVSISKVEKLLEESLVTV